MPKQAVQVPWLDSNSLKFPAIDLALDEPDGLLAVGGDLSSDRLIAAYRHGTFPWFEDDQPILWWSPDPRCIIKPCDIHVSRSLRKAFKKPGLSVRADTAFNQVINNCAAPRAYTKETWITPEMEMAYNELHERGVAHSIEVWRNDSLVGGLYGIALGKLFFGESMFSLEANASKTAFVALARQLQAWDFALIDCQLPNPHLASMGANCISRQSFKEILQTNADLPSLAGSWAISWTDLVTGEN